MVLLCGCATSDFTVTLFRTASSTGISERYSVDSKGNGTKTLVIPPDTSGIRTNHAIDPAIVEHLTHILHDSVTALNNLTHQGMGTVISGLDIETSDLKKELTWENIDPPKLSTGVVDSLYQLMLHAELEMR